jgi:phosphatidylglycerol:prolipoprotein diacylglycerol transferase
MITVGIDPVIVHIGHFAIRWYSLIVLSAIFIGMWLTGREAERKGFKKEAIYDNAFWAIAAGVVGARLFHVIDHWSDTFAPNPVRVFYVWEGGLAIWGGVVGGLLAAAFLAWRRGWQLPRLLDLVAPGLVLGQGIGRAACVITGDAMGKPTDGPFGVAYTSPKALVPELGVYYAPTPIYEGLVNLGIFVLLWQLRKRDLPDGMLALTYLTLYSLGRFLVAYTSSYRLIWAGLTQSQIVSLITVAAVLPLGLYIWLTRSVRTMEG